MLGTVLFLPFILFTLPAGVWVDRLPRRPVLIVGDFGRAALYATVPIAYVADVLTLWQLYVVGFLVGVFQVFFDVAYQSYLPSLVDRDQIIEGNSKFEISRSAAQISGPGLGGILVEILTAPYAVLVDALSFLASGLFILRIRKPEERPERATNVDGTKTSFWQDVKEGLRFVLGNPNLRAQAGCTGTSNFFFSLGFSIYLVFAVRELGLSPGLIGVVFSVGAAGSLVAAFTAMRLSRRFGIGPTTIAVTILQAPAFLAVAFAPEGNDALPFLIVSQLVLGFTLVTYNIVQVSYRQAICPARLQGRMNSAMRFIVWGTIPLGTLAGGALGTLGRAARDDRDRCDRQRPLVPLDPPLAAAPPPRDAGAGRRHAGGRRARARVGATVSSCRSCPRSRPGCASSTRSSHARRSTRPGLRTSRR